MSFTHKEPFPAMQGCDGATMPCRWCVHAVPRHYMRANCAKYSDKPDAVYFKSAPCPRFEEGRDLWSEEAGNEGRAAP